MCGKAILTITKQKRLTVVTQVDAKRMKAWDAAEMPGPSLN